MYDVSPFTLYNWARVDSMKALLEPSKAMSHIQKTAPGPPTVMAVATPAKFPVPTRLASDTMKAWKEEMCSVFPPALLVESPSKRIISLIMRNCTKRVLKVNQAAHPSSIMTRTYVQSTSLMEVIH